MMRWRLWLKGLTVLKKNRQNCMCNKKGNVAAMDTSEKFEERLMETNEKIKILPQTTKPLN